MRPTLLKSSLFWGLWIAGLTLDQLTKRQWGWVYDVQPATIGWLLLVLLIIFVGRLAAVRLPADLTVGLALLSAGVSGNALDIIYQSGVRDWLPWLSWRTNLADVYIWAGLFIWLWIIKKTSPDGPARN
jgi:lipoprotein signal peptidase